MSVKLAAQTQKTAGIPNGMRTATVTAVRSGVVTLLISGGEISSGVGVLESYTPVVGDTVAVFRQDSSWLVLGAIMTSTIAARGQQTGTVSFTFTAVTSATTSITFDTPFAAAPVVVPNIDAASAPTARWVPRAISITATGFTMFVFAADAVANTWTNIPVSWVATARA